MKPDHHNNQKNNTLYDVIIAGAGPVGLFLACELALAKCSVLILEKGEYQDSPVKQAPFGIRGLSAPTIEALDRRGLLQELELYKQLKKPHSNAAPGARRQAGHFAGIPFYENDIDTAQWKYRLPSSTETSLISEMREMETILSRRAETLGVEIKRGHGLINFHQTVEAVTVLSGDQQYQSKWLVGCDGSRSMVRKMGGFEFAGTEPEFTGYSTKVDLADPEKLKPGRNPTEKGMYLQSQPGYIVVQDFDSGAFHDSKEPVTLNHLQEVLRRISDTDVTIRNLYYATTWTDRARQATAYRNGRIFLAGDAAHIHAPLGGQGLNLGLGDAMNLGWKLASAIQNKAPEGLLDSYQAERHPIGTQVLDWSRAQVAIMKPDPAARALHAVVSDLLNTSDGATYFAARVWGIYTHYDLQGNHPLVGKSVPNFEFENGIRVHALLRSGHGLLLDFTADASLKTFADKYGTQIKINYVPAFPKDQLGLNAVLVRPDGIVAWASDHYPDHNELQKAAANWFVFK